MASLPDIPVPESVDSTKGKELEQKFGILLSARQAPIDFAAWTGPDESGLPVAVLFIDIDEFKALNARHSETIVDETVLPEFQRLLKQAVRRRGCAYRQGGEEFLIILPNHTREEGVAFAERLRAEIENTLFAARKLDARITVSLGVAAFPSDGQSFSEVVQAANDSEHLAKDGGRNRVIAYAQRAS